ncbi:unnamed protein product [Peronospora destructor]|uniref:Uncharacterized protein n=1 Tax=Peronospora destructor TaxID=86335 RepID=A0AAV0V031_9STRA|nr:unnamed protein product [Peronospora destructor]
MVLVRSFLRSGAAQCVLQSGSSRFFLSESVACASTFKSKGPPFARYFWYTTAIMLGIPGAIGGVFVYNLKTHDEFYSQFNDRYPDLMKLLLTMTVVPELQSHQKLRLEMSGSATQEEIEALALKQSAHPEKDQVVAITFIEEDEGEKDGNMLSVPTAQEA